MDTTTNLVEHFNAIEKQIDSWTTELEKALDLAFSDPDNYLSNEPSAKCPVYDMVAGNLQNAIGVVYRTIAIGKIQAALYDSGIINNSPKVAEGRNIIINAVIKQ